MGLTQDSGALLFSTTGTWNAVLFGLLSLLIWLALVSLSYFKQKRKLDKKSQHIPGPEGVFLLGNALEMIVPNYGNII